MPSQAFGSPFFIVRYEDHALFVYGAQSLRIPNAFPMALPIADRNRPYAEPGAGKSRIREDLWKPESEPLPYQNFEATIFGFAVTGMSRIGDSASSISGAIADLLWPADSVMARTALALLPFSGEFCLFHPAWVLDAQDCLLVDVHQNMTARSMAYRHTHAPR